MKKISKSISMEVLDDKMIKVTNEMITGKKQTILLTSEEFSKIRREWKKEILKGGV